MDLRRYRLWLSGICGRWASFFGRVEAVKPFLKHVYADRRNHFLFLGWWVQFAEGYVNKDHFKDRLYLYLPKKKQNRWQVVAGDEVEGMAMADLYEGRLSLHQPRALEKERRGEGVPKRESDVLLGLNIGSLFGRQEERCCSCAHGVLVNVENLAGLRNLPRREMFCLAGFRDPGICTHEISKRIALEGCRRAS